jgi:hypothetical protein
VAREFRYRMAHRRKNTDENWLTSQDRADLERVVVRLLDVAARCTDSMIQRELMKLADELVKIIEG